MDTLLITLYSILGIYYLSGVIAYINIYLKNVNRGHVYLNAVRLNRETEIENVFENSFRESSSDDDTDLSYAGY